MGSAIESCYATSGSGDSVSSQQCHSAFSGPTLFCTMGSSPMFEQSVCPQCFDASFIHNPYDERCIDCENAVAVVENSVSMPKTIVFRHLFERNSRLPLECIPHLTHCLSPTRDSRQEFRRQYLRIMLVGPPPLKLLHLGHGVENNKLSLLTYMRNGIAGNITTTENILDRVLQFVCGPVQ